MEVANHVVISVTVDLGEGKALQQKVHGVITYKVNEEGKLLALRAYWEIDDPRNQMVEVATGNGK